MVFPQAATKAREAHKTVIFEAWAIRLAGVDSGFLLYIVESAQSG